MSGQLSTNEVVCRGICGDSAEGSVLTSRHDICFYLTDPKTGILHDKGHDLDGVSLSGKVLVFPSGKGSAVVQDEGLFSLKENGLLPAALIVESPDTVLVFGAIILDLPLVDGLSDEVRARLVDGAHARVDPVAGSIRIVEEQRT